MAKAKAKKKTIYVAVICCLSEDINEGVSASLRNHGDYSCFIGTDRAAVTSRAISTRSRWEKKDCSGVLEYGPYDVLTGTLDSKAQVPTNFRLVKI